MRKWLCVQQKAGTASMMTVRDEDSPMIYPMQSAANRGTGTGGAYHDCCREGVLGKCPHTVNV